MKNGLCVLSLLLTACSALVCVAQEPVRSVKEKLPPSITVTLAQPEENLALDMVLSDLLTYKPIDFYKGHTLLFDSKEWPTYKPQRPLIVLGDLSLVTKQVEDATKNMDAAMKLLSHNSEWKKALKRLYPDCKVYVSSCTLSHVSNTLRVRLRFGPSEHGAFADYILKRERETWKITTRHIIFYL